MCLTGSGAISIQITALNLDNIRVPTSLAAFKNALQTVHMKVCVVLFVTNINF